MSKYILIGWSAQSIFCNEHLLPLFFESKNQSKEIKHVKKKMSTILENKKSLKNKNEK